MIGREKIKLIDYKLFYSCINALFVMFMNDSFCN